MSYCNYSSMDPQGRSLKGNISSSYFLHVKNHMWDERQSADPAKEGCQASGLGGRGTSESWKAISKELPKTGLDEGTPLSNFIKPQDALTL